MPSRRGRAIGIVTLLVLFAAAAPLALHSAGAVRWGALSLLWWYAALVAPVLAVLAAAAALLVAPE